MIKFKTPEQIARVLDPTNREKEIMALVAQGMRNKEIGLELSITEQTVKNHMHSISIKTGLNRYEIIRKTLEEAKGSAA